MSVEVPSVPEQAPGCLVVIGSSSANGIGDPEGGLAARARRDFYQLEQAGGPRHGVWDRTATAERIDSSRRHFEADLQDRRLRSANAVFVLNLGVFDSSINLDAGRNRTPFSVYCEHLTAIGDLAIHHGAHNPKKLFVMLGMASLQRTEVVVNGKELFAERERAKYERVNSAQADRMRGAGCSVKMINPYGLLEGYLPTLMPGYLDRDGVHPGPLTHDAVFGWVKEAYTAHLGGFGVLSAQQAENPAPLTNVRQAS